MKGYKLDGVEGIFIHLETDDEAVVLRSITGQNRGGGEYNKIASILYYMLTEQFNVKGNITIEVRPIDNAWTFKV